MATAALSSKASQRSRLQAGRLQARQQRSTANRPANDPSFGQSNVVNLQPQAFPTTAANNTQNFAQPNAVDAQTQRLNQLKRSRNQARMSNPGQVINFPTRTSVQKEEQPTQTQQEQQEEQAADKEQIIKSTLANFLTQTQAARKDALAKQQAQTKEQEQTNQTREHVKQETKAAARRGIIYIVDSIAAALDIGSLGVSLLIDFFIYMFTLGWLNLEMIYGTYIAKKKSKYISPISWAPVPAMDQIDKGAYFLQGFIIAADIFVVVVGFTLFTFIMCILYDYMTIMSFQGVTATLSAGGANLCTGSLASQLIGYIAS